VVDFLSKRLVLAHADDLQQRTTILGDLVRLAYVRNPGAAMGLFTASRGIFIGISIVASLALVFFYLRTDRRLRVRRGALAAILGGALGNLIDRIFYDGLVIDFIDIGLGTHRFYTFNVADMGVTLGGTVLFICLLRESRRLPSDSP
jgi:signal peptidase II